MSDNRGFSLDIAPRYMIRDRDRIYGIVVTRRLRAIGIRDKPTAPASPWQNGFAERLIGSVRRECLDHVIVWGEPHLRRIRSWLPGDRPRLAGLHDSGTYVKFTQAGADLFA